MLVGGSLVALVAVATCVVAWLLWARAEERGRAEDDRAAQATVERLQNSVGRVLTSLRTAAGLVDAKGGVDTASFHAWAQAVGSIGATDGLALAEIVPANDARRSRRQGDDGSRSSPSPGSSAARGPARPTFPSSPSGRAGHERRRTRLRPAERTGAPASDRAGAVDPANRVHEHVPFLIGGSGFQAFRPVYAPTQESGEARRLGERVVRAAHPRKRLSRPSGGRSRARRLRRH